MKIVIIGNSAAGISCAEEIRKVRSDCSITIISDEAAPAYDRTRLLEQLFVKSTDSSFFIKDDAFYQQHSIELIRGKTVQSLDTRRRKIKLDDDTTIDFDRLLVATGTAVKLPEIKGINKDNVFSIRTFDDIKGIRDLLIIAHSIFIMGEAPWIEPLSRRLSSRADTEVFVATKNNGLFQNITEEGSLRLIRDQEVSELIGEKEIQAVKMSTGKVFGCSLFIVDAPLEPNLRLIKGTPMERARGILVDEGMRTSIENIFAAGDVAEVRDQEYAQGWQRAVSQGMVAAQSILRSMDQ